MQELTDKTFFEAISTQSGFVVVDYWATWCGPCKTMAPILTELDEEDFPVNFAKVDVDQNPEVVKWAAVQSMPTFVIYADGEEVARRVGACSKGEFIAWILDSI